MGYRQVMHWLRLLVFLPSRSKFAPHVVLWLRHGMETESTRPIAWHRNMNYSVNDIKCRMCHHVQITKRDASKSCKFVRALRKRTKQSVGPPVVACDNRIDVLVVGYFHKNTSCYVILCVPDNLTSPDIKDKTFFRIHGDYQ